MLKMQFCTIHPPQNYAEGLLVLHTTLFPLFYLRFFFLSLSKSKLINFRLYSFHFLAIIAICVRFFPLSHSTPRAAQTQTHFASAQILGTVLQRAVPLALNPEEKGRESLALLFRVRGALCLPLFPFPSIVTLLP